MSRMENQDVARERRRQWGFWGFVAFPPLCCRGIYIVDGEVQITIDSKEMIVKKGEMVILPANKPHALNALSPFKMLLVMIKS